MTELRQTAAPTRLGRYEVVMKIASGGMATVYLGRMVSKGAFQRSVAIKVLHAELASDPGFVAMFLDEARLSAQIRHPNVVDVYDVDAEAGHLFIVMGYIEGASLYDLNKISRKQNRVIPRAISLRVLFDALTGLHAAHELADSSGRNLEIVHRDMSPQNLLVGLDGATRVSDFGVAKSTGRLATTETRDTVKGKLQYLAPEQMQRDAEIDRRVDVFAAGIILWELLTSRGLFVGGTHAETLAAVLTQPIPKPSKYATDLDEALDAVCMKALERDPAKRFATAGDFADALEEAAGAQMATPKTVGKFVRELAPPKVGEGREAMRSSADLSDIAAASLAGIPALTPSSGAPRKLTPAPTPAVVAPPSAASPASGSEASPAEPPPPSKSVPPRAPISLKRPGPPTPIAPPSPTKASASAAQPRLGPSPAKSPASVGPSKLPPAPPPRPLRAPELPPPPPRAAATLGAPSAVAKEPAATKEAGSFEGPAREARAVAIPAPPAELLALVEPKVTAPTEPAELAPDPSDGEPPPTAVSPVMHARAEPPSAGDVAPPASSAGDANLEPAEAAAGEAQHEHSDSPFEIVAVPPTTGDAERRARARKLAIGAVALAGVLGLIALIAHAARSPSAPTASLPAASASPSQRAPAAQLEAPAAITTATTAAAADPPSGTASSAAAAPVASATEAPSAAVATPPVTAAPVGAGAPPISGYHPPPSRPPPVVKTPATHGKPPPRYVP